MYFYINGRTGILLAMKEITIYTDGASRGNPGPGGWGAVIIAEDKVMEIGGAAKRATNNQMELEAVLQVLSGNGALTAKEPLVVYSDSAYVVNGLNSWVYGWEKKGWKTINKTPVENKELWEKLLTLLKKYNDRLTITKVSGHAGELYNERCDEIAVSLALGKKTKLFSGSINEYDQFLADMGTVTKKGSGKKLKNNAPAYSYVSLIDGKVYVDKTWQTCEKRVKGKKGVKYKKVFSKVEETELVQYYMLQSLL